MNLSQEFLNKRFPKADSEQSNRRLALHMRQEGYTYKEIGAHIGTSDVQAQRWVAQEIEAIEALEIFDTNLVKREALLRLDELSRNLWVQVDGGSIKAVMALLKIEERRAKILGLDAPMLVNIEDKAREVARKNGLDEDEFVAAAQEIVKESRYGSE